MKIVLVILTTISLTACEHQPVDPFNSPYYRVPVQSTLKLHQPLTIPANQARVLIQNGKILSRSQIDQYYPHCEFEIRTLKDAAQTITPDSFIVIKVARDMESSLDEIMYASMVADNSGFSLIAYSTLYYLQSDKQPDVLRMTCLYWTDDPI